MTSKWVVPTVLGLFCTTGAWCQNLPAEHENVPIYQVTVTERTVKAVDYQYRSGPTPVDFRGTVLLPKAKGDAMVESKAGRTEIDAHFQRLEAPTRYGAEYLTYVLWAITPEGHARNLGEVLPGSSDHAHLHVTTDLQAFGMIVTAEPYSAVRQPSDVVVMENEVRPDTDRPHRAGAGEVRIASPGPLHLQRSVAASSRPRPTPRGCPWTATRRCSKSTRRKMPCRLLNRWEPTDMRPTPSPRPRSYSASPSRTRCRRPTGTRW